MEERVCARCEEKKSADDFYFVSRKLGTRRGICKPCMAEVKQAQRDPEWLPTCQRCGALRPRAGSGRRLCSACFTDTYDAEAKRGNGSHELALKPCTLCGVKRLRADHTKGTSLCAVCRSVQPSRRKRLAEFNLTPREYSELLEAQGGRCSICKNRSRRTLNVDHQHAEPSIVRGLVCSRCNSLLGMAKDNARVLRSAAEYLESPPIQEIYPGRVARKSANRDYAPMVRGATMRRRRRRRS